ncbi:MAG: radical SAM protein [Alphaproteobacteria bacterium]|nr:radical SAM protein [Alphaproteobacteria bacterium]
MKIQSLSIVVPSSGCINKCQFCVSRMRHDEYPNMLDEKLPFYDLYEADYVRRLEFARDNGCNTVMLTGDSEPQQNRSFLQRFGTMNKNLPSPFRWIEMQTTGVMLNDPYLRFLRNHVGVSTISVSISSFDNGSNNEIIGTPDKHQVCLESLCQAIKKYDFNLRLSVNLTDQFNGYSNKPEKFFTYCRLLGADQVTLRILYTGDGETEQAEWIRKHSIADKTESQLIEYVKEEGRALERLEYGRVKYSILGMSTVIDDDCMAQDVSDSYKYVILRPNCKLYSRWDDPGSLIF